MTWVEGPVLVRVPATSANLGPGFDALGLALSLHDEIRARVAPAGLSIEVSGEGAADDADAGEKHLDLVMQAQRQPQGVKPRPQVRARRRRPDEHRPLNPRHELAPPA